MCRFSDIVHCDIIHVVSPGIKNPHHSFSTMYISLSNFLSDCWVDFHITATRTVCRLCNVWQGHICINENINLWAFGQAFYTYNPSLSCPVIITRAPDYDLDRGPLLVTPLSKYLSCLCILEIFLANHDNDYKDRHIERQTVDDEPISSTFCAQSNQVMHLQLPHSHQPMYLCSIIISSQTYSFHFLINAISLKCDVSYYMGC